MTAQEAIRRIRDHNEVHSVRERNFAVYITEALNMAIEALEKQIPKKPYKRKEGKETNYYCSCKHYLGDETEIQLIAIRPRFCDNCGQALDWSDDNG